MQSFPDNLPPLMQQAISASQAKDSDTALSLFQQASQAEPGSPLPHFLMGAELAQLERMTEAEAAYARAVILAPDFSIARFELGVLQFVTARPAIALVTWQALLELPDTDPLKLFVLGYAKLMQDAFDDAQHYFEQGIAANTTNPALNGNIQLLIAEIHRTRGTQAPATEKMPAQEEPGDNHFLLSNYNQSRLH
ncbi:tetratricopeptide repeat protein [Collimonas sp.]|jgi:tetratricopeptide (TPR) repeat protein|uniref:tetratricopeptide repeat protein n=1 Tax=Collimonas sp. TaxID=1963772 RepID=UPI002BF4EC73|nr:tetratricopeptide repeat protein [Collimonas sp.]HWW08334.1 tetratricopeptide repeat protein [Collimonas sp.]